MIVNNIVSIDEYIKFHTEIRYCEAIILRDGKIIDAVPSHINEIVELSDKGYNEINSIMPSCASPIEWLVNYTGLVALWYDSFKFSNITKRQLTSIRRLICNNIISDNIIGFECNEKSRCEELDKYSKGLTNKLKTFDDKVLIISKNEINYTSKSLFCSYI